MKIYVWPDYMWCEEEFIEDFKFASDDHIMIDVPDDIEDIDEYLDGMRPKISPLFKNSNIAPLF